MNAKIKRSVGWAGGKGKLSKRIVAELGPHDEYQEWFVGGNSILFAKPRARIEILNDANAKVISVLRCIRDDSPKLLEILGPIKFSKAAFDAAMEKTKGNKDNPMSTEMDAAQLVAWWMGPGGMAGTKQKPWFAQRHSDTGGCPEKRWESFKASIPEQSERMQTANLYCGDFRGLKTEDREGVSVYVDSPYFSKSFEYEIDFTAADHDDLAAKLNAFRRVRAVVSYGIRTPEDRERLDQLYPPSKWRRIEIEMNKNMASASGTARRNVEVLLVNDAGATA